MADLSTFIFGPQANHAQRERFKIGQGSAIAQSQWGSQSQCVRISKHWLALPSLVPPCWPADLTDEQIRSHLINTRSGVWRLQTSNKRGFKPRNTRNTGRAGMWGLRRNRGLCPTSTSGELRHSQRIRKKFALGGFPGIAAA